MATLSQNYQSALKEFVTLTARSAETLKSKGKASGIAKLASIFKKGKSIEQLIDSFSSAVEESEKPKSDPGKAIKAIESAYEKLNLALKANVAAYEAEEQDLGPADKAMKDGFSVFINRLQMLRKTAKITLVQRQTAMAQKAGTATGASVAAAELKQCYLTMKKGVEETEGSLKLFLAKPTAQNLEHAFCSMTNARSIGAAVTMYKQRVLKKDPDIANKLRADPIHLLTHINDMSQNKGMSFWESKFKMDKPGWETAAKKTAQDALNQMKNWRMMADELKSCAG